MCKKVFVVATLAVVAAVFLVGGRRVASTFRYWKHQLRTAVEKRIPPEQEIARLRMEVDNLALEDSQAYDKVVRQGREVKKLQARVDDLKKELGQEQASIREMKGRLTADGEFITVNGERVRRSEFEDELLQAAEKLMDREDLLKSLQDQLKAKKDGYEANKRALRKREGDREKLKAELQRLETALTKERQAQARAKDTLNDPGYLRLKDEISAVRERIESLTDKRELENEIRNQNTIRADQQRREKATRIKRFLDDPRFNTSTGQ